MHKAKGIQYIGSAVFSAIFIILLMPCHSFAPDSIGKQHGYSIPWKQKTAAEQFNDTWAHIYGSPNSSTGARSVQPTSDGGYIVAGGLDGDMWIVKLNATGTINWQKTYGGDGDDYAHSIQETTDGGFIVAGQHQGGYNIFNMWVLKLDSAGTIVWQKFYGQNVGYYYYDYDIKQTTDGGYILTGTALYNTWPYTADMWVLKLDANGDVLWQNRYCGNPFYCEARSIQQTSDGGYILAGTEGMNVYTDIWILKLDASGAIVWEQQYGDSNADDVNAIQQTSDDGYIVAGSTTNPLTNGSSGSDIWIFKLDSSGYIAWQNRYMKNDTSGESATSIQQTTDGGYIVANSLWDQSYYYAWIFKLDFSGNITWQKTYDKNTHAGSIRQTSDGGFVLAGYRGYSDPYYQGMWVVKINADGSMDPSCSFVTDTNAIVSPTTVPAQGASATMSYNGTFLMNGDGISMTSYETDTMLCSSYAFLKPYLNRKPVIDDSGSPKANGILEPGETAGLIGTLENTGRETATMVSGHITTPDPRITLIQPDASYPDIAVGDHQSCTSCYEIQASPNRPAMHWDFLLTEEVSTPDIDTLTYPYVYHVGESFNDVPVTNVFYSDIETIFHTGIIAGCAQSTFCPIMKLQRQQMAKFICNALEISLPYSCWPASCERIFSDVSGANIFCPYIEALYYSSLIIGCQNNPPRYCPTNNAKRKELAKIICTSMEQLNPNSCLPPGATCSGIFGDVSSANPFCIYIEGIYNANVISGCQTNPLLFCPENEITREQMAKFITNAFGLEL